MTIEFTIRVKVIKKKLKLKIIKPQRRKGAKEYKEKRLRFRLRILASTLTST